jgi:hypothetical protein
VPFAEGIRREAGVPTGAGGLITEPEHADEIVAAGTTTVGIIKANGSPVAVPPTPDDVPPLESADARYPLFRSPDCTLVRGDPDPCNGPGGQDIFVQDTQTGIFVLASRHTEGMQASATS